ncbi:amidohydrolase family protein [Patescibacteria group bacterium]|nr:amidohydrolase family protein [Patescibacteria group bacterium]
MQNLKQELLREIRQQGGFVNCHGHFDKAFYISKERLAESMVDMEKKWHMSDDIKRNSSIEEVKDRIRRCLDIMIDQGVKTTGSFIDAYEAVGAKNIDAALTVKNDYKDRINFLIITQPLGGLVDNRARNLYEELTAKADMAGGLPSKDRPLDRENLDYLFAIAKNLKKPLHVHIDQENNPYERDTSILIEYTKRYHMQGEVTAVHAVSTSAQPPQVRREIYQSMADSGVSVVVCPSAALAMRQLDKFQAPIHNSIANVPEMLAAGVTVGLGVDNIYDFYQPFVDGDMWTEMRILQEACRYYDFEQLVQIATINGQKILSKTSV